MNLTLEIPDDLARHLSTEPGDLSRHALEAFALEEYKLRHITKAQLRRLLGGFFIGLAVIAYLI
jgi:hypothetical protein